MKIEYINTTDGRRVVNMLNDTDDNWDDFLPDGDGSYEFMERWWAVVVFGSLFLVFSLILGLVCLVLKLLS
jgi:hypothetical protein